MVTWMSYYEKLKYFCETTEITDVRYLPGRILHETRFIIYGPLVS